MTHTLLSAHCEEDTRRIQKQKTKVNFLQGFSSVVCALQHVLKWRDQACYISSIPVPSFRFLETNRYKSDIII